MPEAVWFEPRCHGGLFEHSVVAVFGFSWRDVADGFQQPARVLPVGPFERGDFDGLMRPPWPAPMDDLGLVAAVDGLRECVVIGVADAADGRLDAGFCPALSVF